MQNALPLPILTKFSTLNVVFRRRFGYKSERVLFAGLLIPGILHAESTPRRQGVLYFVSLHTRTQQHESLRGSKISARACIGVCSGANSRERRASSFLAELIRTYVYT